MRKENVDNDEKDCKSEFLIKKEPIEYETGCMWEDYPWIIEFNKLIKYGKSCKHCLDTHIHVYKRTWDNSTYEEEIFICPRVVVASNEGNYNSTGVCLDCILEAAQTL